MAESQLRAPMTMPTLRIELDGVKQAMVVAIRDSQQELQAAVQSQLTACLAGLQPEDIIAKVRMAFAEAVHEAVRTIGPELVQEAVAEYFTTGAGSQIIASAIREKFKL